MKYSADDRAMLALAEARGLEEKGKWELLDAVSSPAALFDADFSALPIKNGKNDVYNSIRNALRPSAAEQCEKALAKRGVVPVPYTHPLYPSRLRDIDVPPLCLYAKGDLSLLSEPLFCIVGSRRTLPSIVKHTERIAGELASRFGILTGAADGGDAAAAQGALPAGKLVCMLPCGFAALPEKPFYDEVAKSGLLLSPFPSEVQTRNYLYRARNRVMAALAEGILVVSAGKVSGAAMTAEFGLEWGKPVYAFPYTIGTLSGEGCNELLKKGAYPTENVLDILPDFGINLSKEPANLSLTAEERLVLRLLKEGEELHVSALAKACNMAEYELAALLSALELKNLITRSGGNCYRAV